MQRLDATGVASRRVSMDGAAHAEIAGAIRWLKTHDTNRSVSYLPWDLPDALESSIAGDSMSGISSDRRAPHPAAGAMTSVSK